MIDASAAELRRRIRRELPASAFAVRPWRALWFLPLLAAAIGGTGLLADYQSARTATANFTTATGFPTAKVVGGFDFVGDAYTGSNTPAPDANPMDCNGHGSHVAGTAAGFGVTGAGVPYAGPWDTTTNFAALLPRRAHNRRVGLDHRVAERMKKCIERVPRFGASFLLYVRMPRS